MLEMYNLLAIHFKHHPTENHNIHFFLEDNVDTPYDQQPTAYLLYMVNFVVLALLVTGDLPFRLVHKIPDTPQLCALPDRIFDGLGQRQP